MGMTSPDELHHLIEASLRDPSKEPDFMRALLEAELYVHLPLSDDSGKVRLVCFTRPDGVSVIPVFSDHKKADVAAQGVVRIGVMRARELFAITPGATFMLDPNDTSTTLYPEEIQALLRGELPSIAPTRVDAGPIGMSPALPDDRWLGQLLVDVVRDLEPVQAVHLVQGHAAGSVEPTMLVGIFAVEPALGERVARAVAVALNASPRKPRINLDLTVYDPATPPDWVTEPELASLWRRARRGVH
jgi:hypothetical protein